MPERDQRLQLTSISSPTVDVDDESSRDALPNEAFQTTIRRHRRCRGRHHIWAVGMVGKRALHAYEHDNTAPTQSILTPV